eukprot:scaffold6178_cov143-Skeletonema_menzelii.AAC.4
MTCPAFTFYTLNSNLSHSIIVQVPPGVWEVFNTREICCGVHAPFSTTCETKGPNNPNVPTLEPTIALPSVPDTEEVALKFDLNGLPDNMDIIKLKANVLEALKIVLAQLKERVPSLRVTEISERACNERRLEQQQQLRMAERMLRGASLCYTVEVRNNDNGREYETLIVSEARASSDMILDRIRTKLNYVNVGMGIGGENGNGSVNGGSNTNNTNNKSNTATTRNTNGGGGLPSWGIALIVILLLILFSCIGYCIFISVRNDKDEKYATNVLFNNPVPRPQFRSAPPPPRRRSFAQRGGQALRQSFARRTNRSSNVRDRPRRRDDGRRRRSSFSRYDSFRSSFTGRVHRPRRSRGDRSRRHDGGPSINLSNPQDPRFSTDELTVNTYTTNKKSPQEPPMNAMVLYEPNYAKPDPEGSTAGDIVLALTNGENNTRPEEPNTKPKLEPEEVLLIESAPLDRSRRSRRHTPDPSDHFDDVFVEPQQVLYGANEDDDEDEYVYRPQRTTKRSDELEESLSFATEDPEEEERRRAKKSRKKKKKRGSSSNSRKRYERRRSSSTPESSDRQKAHRAHSGVESVGTDVGSMDLESKASA